jgi:glycine cleavage system H protein
MRGESIMPLLHEISVDKFTFRAAADRLYSPDGLWAQPLDEPAARPQRVRVGITDYLQQRSGDVAFATPRPSGTVVERGGDLADLETVKVNLVLASPVRGVIAEANGALGGEPEAVNQDPYGAGWLVVVAVDDWETERGHLMTAEAHLERVRRDAEIELGAP